jgi:arylsulfatase A-like enzyme
MVALAFVQGFGAPAFVSAIASDAIDATLPFLGILLVARFVERRYPARAPLVQRIHVVVQALLACMTFGWWWVEPHTLLTSLTGSSLGAMAWQALAGALAGLLLALVAERALNPSVLREVWLATGIVFLIAGGRLYRAFDHVEAGIRFETAAAIAAGFVAVALAAYFLLRRRPHLATAIPALAPGLACALLLVAWNGRGPAVPSTRDSIVLVVIDTLRADIADGGIAGQTDAVSGGPGAMPELARIARSGVRFTQAVSPAPWTLPATVSLLSGWNPHRHHYGESVSEWEVTTGNPAALYLPASMRDAGYLTAAFVNNPWLRPYFGFGSGFYTMRPYHGRALDGIALALGWLSDHTGDPSFTMLHLMDPHWPYDAPAGFGAARVACPDCDSLYYCQYGHPTAGNRAEVRRRYSAAVIYTDAMLGRFYDTLVATGVLEHTWLIIAADHGEEFWEHGGFLHGHTLYDELLRVPLLVVPPRANANVPRGIRVETQVRLEDVSATMLEIAGIDAARAIDGRSLLPLIGGGADATARVSIGGFIKSPDNLSYSTRNPPWKAVVSTDILAVRLFRLDADPGEHNNLLFNDTVPAGERAGMSRQYMDLAAEARSPGLDVLRSRAVGNGAAPDADTRRDLRSLGYAQ